MQETRELGLLLWVGLWTIAGLTALCLALVGGGLQHVLIGLVALALAYAPFGIGQLLERLRGRLATTHAS
ncbi:hypothetical protein [Aeromicrobium alkaliterrae]|uniref:Uncharacterized protein n=1 Tax=Aeromicrobium alkaliterrae TaxID=302168 RepID=A0ABP4WAN9_9ACTN